MWAWIYTNLWFFYFFTDCSDPCYEAQYPIGGKGTMLKGDLCSDTRPTPLNYACNDPEPCPADEKTHYHIYLKKLRYKPQSLFYDSASLLLYSGNHCQPFNTYNRHTGLDINNAIPNWVICELKLQIGLLVGMYGLRI